MGCVYLIEKKKMDKEHVLLGSRRLGRGRGRNGSERERELMPRKEKTKKIKQTLKEGKGKPESSHSTR